MTPSVVNTYQSKKNKNVLSSQNQNRKGILRFKKSQQKNMIDIENRKGLHKLLRKDADV